MVQFIGQNPAFEGAKGVYDMQAAQGQADLTKFRLDEAMRTRDANDAVDAALRDYITRNYPAGSAPGVAQTGPQGASLANQQPNVTTAAAGPMSGAGPGPAATAGQGNAPGFDALVQQLAPQMPGGGQPNPAYKPDMVARPGMGGQNIPLPNAPVGAAQPAALNRVDLARTLAKTPGTGQAALQLIQDQEAAEAQADKDKDHAVENFFKSVDAGDTNSAHYWAGKAGMPLSDGDLQDAELLKHLGVVGKWKQLYGGDLTNFGKFTSAYFDALQRGETVNPYSLYAANPPESRNAGRNSTKQADYSFLTSDPKGPRLSPGEAASRVWSGGAAGGGMNYSDALKIARDILKVKVEGLPYRQRKAAMVNFDKDVEAMAQRYMGGADPADDEGDTPDDSSGGDSGGGFMDQASGRDVEQDENGNWMYSDDGSPYVPPSQ